MVELLHSFAIIVCVFLFPLFLPPSLPPIPGYFCLEQGWLVFVADALPQENAQEPRCFLISPFCKKHTHTHSTSQQQPLLTFLLLFNHPYTQKRFSFSLSLSGPLVFPERKVHAFPILQVTRETW